MDKRDTWKLTIVSLMVMPILVQAKEKFVTKVADNTPVLPEIAVTASEEAPGYSPPYTSTATKSNIPIFDSPFSVQVIPEQVFKDQRSTTITDALQNVSGVRSHSNAVEGYVYRIRGFRSLNIFRNGLAFSDAIATVHETANLESLDVLKGPASVLFGRIEPGGIINKTTKRPLDTPYYSLAQEFGSYSRYRTVWDATGPILKDGSLSYRLSGAYQNSGSFRQFQRGDRIFVSPSLLWRPSARTEFKLDFEYMYNGAQSDTGFPALGYRPAPIPIRRSFQEPNDPLDRTESLLVAYNLRHAFNANWAITNRFHAAWADLYKNNISSVSLRDDGRTLERHINYQALDGEAYATNLDLTGKFDFIGAQHNVLLGFDYYHDYYRYSLTNLASVPVTNPSDPDFAGNLQDPESFIDIFNPRYGTVPASKFAAVAHVRDPATAFFTTFQREQYGVYFQDHFTFFNKLHILGGGRYDWAYTTGATASSPEEVQGTKPDKNRDGQFSPRVGILYQPIPWIGIYGSWSNSFGVNNGKTANGKLAPPETGTQWEAGIKAELFDRRLSTTLAFYHLTKHNILTADLSTPDPTDSIPTGEQRSQGFELDILGRITEELSVIGNYAYTDAKVTRDNSGFLGKRVETVPEHSGRVFLTYDFKRFAPLNGWRFGFGVTATSNRPGNLQNNFILPGYVRLDTFAAYTFLIGKSRLTAQLNIDNLTNQRYFDGTDVYFNNTSARLGIFPGTPLTAIGSIRVEY